MGRRAPPTPSGAGGAHGVAQRPVFSMPQNTVAGAAMMPVTLFRAATGPYHCPSHTCVGYCVSRTCTASAMGLSLEGLVSRAYWSRSDSSSLSQGQPNMAVSQEALMNPALIGFRMSAATHEVRKPSMPLNDSLGDPHGNRALHTL